MTPPTTPEELIEYLASLEIQTTTYTHAPVFTVEQSKKLRGDLPGGHCKSLFLKDRRDGLWLVVALEHRKIDLKALRRALGAHKGLSFEKPERMNDVLGVEPGAVTPFAVFNDADNRVEVVLDRQLLDTNPLNFHPLRNDRTTAIAPADLLEFLRRREHSPRVIDFDSLSSAP